MISTSNPFSPNLLSHIYDHRNWKNKIFAHLMFYPRSDAFSKLVHSLGVLILDGVCLWTVQQAGFDIPWRRKALLTCTWTWPSESVYELNHCSKHPSQLFNAGFGVFARLPFSESFCLGSCILTRSFALSGAMKPQVSSSLWQMASPLCFPSHHDHLCEVIKGGSQFFNSCYVCVPLVFGIVSENTVFSVQSK